MQMMKSARRKSFYPHPKQCTDAQKIRSENPAISRFHTAFGDTPGIVDTSMKNRVAPENASNHEFRSAKCLFFQISKLQVFIFLTWISHRSKQYYPAAPPAVPRKIPWKPVSAPIPRFRSSQFPSSRKDSS